MVVPASAAHPEDDACGSLLHAGITGVRLCGTSFVDEERAKNRTASSAPSGARSAVAGHAYARLHHGLQAHPDFERLLPCSVAPERLGRDERDCTRRKRCGDHHRRRAPSRRLRDLRHRLPGRRSVPTRCGARQRRCRYRRYMARRCACLPRHHVTWLSELLHDRRPEHRAWP